MTMRTRKTFTEEELQQCWQLWRQGLGFSEIARELASKPGTIFGVIRSMADTHHHNILEISSI